MNTTHIDYYTDIVEEYLKDIKSIENQDQLNSHCKKWQQLFPSIQSQDYGEFKKNKKIIENLKEEPTTDQYITLRIIAPYELLKIIVMAEEFVVTTGLVLLQLNQPYQCCLLSENSVKWID